MRQAASLGGSGVGLTTELEILDSGDTADSAVKAALAATSAGARMLIGPLFAEQAAAVARAVPARVPVVALTNDTSVAGGNLFVFGITPRHSAQAILSLAAARGLRDIGMVVPPGAFGERSVAAARSLAGPLGITLRPPLVRSSAEGLAQALRAGGDGLPDAVYIPSADAALPRHLAALRGSAVQVLGSVQWSALDVTTDPVFRDAWFAAPDPLRFEPFANLLESQSDGPAGILAGLAFDGAEMARLLGRLDMQDRKGLLRKDGFNGVLGPYRFLPSGDCQRGLAVLKVGDGTITLLGATSV